MTFLVIWLICAIVGGLIGNGKGRKVEGVVLGGLLGLIGILIIVLLPAKDATA